MQSIDQTLEDLCEPVSGWWAGDGDNDYSIGPYESKDDAIDEAIRASVYDKDLDEKGNIVLKVYLVKAAQENQRLSDFVDPVAILAMAEDDVAEFSDFFGSPTFNVSKVQIADLHEMLILAIDDWQERNNLQFRQWAFVDIEAEEIAIIGVEGTRFQKQPRGETPKIDIDVEIPIDEKSVAVNATRKKAQKTKPKPKPKTNGKEQAKNTGAQK